MLGSLQALMTRSAAANPSSDGTHLGAVGPPGTAEAAALSDC